MAALKLKNAFFNGTPSIKDLLGEKLNFSEQKNLEKSSPIKMLRCIRPSQMKPLSV